MLHAEGVHKPDGRFHTGLTEVVTLPVVGNVTQPVLGLRHTALWDLHIWREAPGTPATISLLNPRETPGPGEPSQRLLLSHFVRLEPG